MSGRDNFSYAVAYIAPVQKLLSAQAIYFHHQDFAGMKYLYSFVTQSLKPTGGLYCLWLVFALPAFVFGQSATPLEATTPTQTGPNANPVQTKPAPSPTPARRPPSELQKALDEFRVQMGSLSTSKSGKVKAVGRQNSLTGRLYEYLRNDLFDAIPHEVRQRGGTKKSLLRRNQFGFTVSGPVWVPKLYDGRGRTFFSFSYEGTRERIAQSALYTLPTDPQRNGSFADLVDTAGKPVTIYDPATTRLNPNYDPSKPVALDNLQYLRDPFPGNVLPDNRLDPVARKLVTFYPRSNINVGPFLQNNYWINSPFENRADGTIGKLDHRLSEKQQLSVNWNWSQGLRKAPELYPGPANPGNPSYHYENGQLTATDTFTVSPKTIWNFRLTASLNRVTSANAIDTKRDYPRELGIAGIFSKSIPRFSFSNNLLALGPRNALFRDASYAYSQTTGVSINRQNHTIRLTGQALRRYANGYNPSIPAGLFYFNNALTGLPGVANTGNSFASFLLGLVNRAEETVVLHPSYYSKNFFDLNASDEYRVRPGLTVNFSLSLEVATPRLEKYDRQSTISLEQINPANGQPGALIFAGRDGQGRGLQPTTARWEPAISMSLNPWNDRFTVVRASYSLNYEDYPINGRHFGTQGFNAAPIFNSANDQLTPAFLLREGMPLNFAQPPYLDPTAANGTEPEFLDQSGLLPRTEQWSLSVQRELPRAFSLEARYTGTRYQNLFVDGFIRLNAVPVSKLSFREQLYVDAFRNSLRPYPQYRTFDVGGLYPGGDAEGHSLTLTLDKRLSAGLYGRATYRFSKQMDNYSTGAPQDPQNLDAEWALSISDVRHSVQLSYTYELPFGKGKPLFNRGGWSESLMGGWSLSAISSITGGTPLQLRPVFNRTGGIVNSLRVNVVPGVDPTVQNPSAEQWFNPAAYTQPDDFTLGNASRTDPVLREPGDQFHHLSLTKRVQLTSDTSLEWVTEAFNFPNHANLNDPDTRIGPLASPNLNAGKIIGSTGGRVMQMGLRILF